MPVVNGRVAQVDYLWNDLDGDGAQDSNEPSLANVLVTLNRLIIASG